MWRFVGMGERMPAVGASLGMYALELSHIDGLLESGTDGFEVTAACGTVDVPRRVSL